ncbi:hypothetical protein ET445_08580 [Agromyces protaetiae]|uniref:DUF2178 domain-containing protein n=1 Tax=Agromyces protaetiae TaxID=2509455 RepID=A0A4P6FAY1_9MICO|nr:hypothetical protein [Agromyces protaetiae]QAY73390.1 hypothetical protein ET445_08580 [Agromyces protaetiae]
MSREPDLPDDALGADRAGSTVSYEEKGTWSFLAVAIAGYAVYLSLVLPAALTTPVAEIEWVWPMVWTIVGAIGAGIVARILVEMFWPSDGYAADERDKEIDRTGERVGNSFIVIGALAALVLCWFRVDWFWIANAIYVCFVLAALLSSATKLVAYRRGGFQTW